MIHDRIRDYRVMRVLGEGGMSTVYEALHEHSGRKAAIKLLTKDFAADQRFTRRFIQERRILDRLSDHPGIVPNYDWGQLPSGRLFLIMEYAEGQTLGELLHAQRRVPILTSVQIIRQVADSCDFAHRNQIVHRDLKPSNVILSPDASLPGGMRTRLLDFGIAKFFVHQPKYGPRTQTGAIMGTVAYMSPEQIRAAGDVGPKSDVYSLGIVFYEMLSGGFPFAEVAEESEAMPLLTSHLFSTAEPVRHKNTAVPEGLAHLLHSMLAKDPAQRPTMATVAADLDTLLSSGVLPEPAEEEALLKSQTTPSQPRTDTPSERAPAQKKRAVLLFLLLLGLLALLLYEYVRRQ